ncbi:uncharacterized protein VTP21DRAFT_10062 [Calcarisporiella thermophila]|uniref:uncharacterized protein n=1 Tax=Calcarisporiella thermophila TaxID=911321 RepID=UPI003742F8CB
MSSENWQKVSRRTNSRVPGKKKSEKKNSPSPSEELVSMSSNAYSSLSQDLPETKSKYARQSSSPSSSSSISTSFSATRVHRQSKKNPASTKNNGMPTEEQLRNPIFGGPSQASEEKLRQTKSSSKKNSKRKSIASRTARRQRKNLSFIWRFPSFLIIMYLLYATFFVCPMQNPRNMSTVCRGISQTERVLKQIMDPWYDKYAAQYVDKAQKYYVEYGQSRVGQLIGMYKQHGEPLVDPLKPYFHQLKDKAFTYYHVQLQPLLAKAFEQVTDRYHASQPYLDQATKHMLQLYNQHITPLVQPAIPVVSQFVSNVQQGIIFAQNVYQQHIHPHASDIYYSHISPYMEVLIKHGEEFVHQLPDLAREHILFLSPKRPTDFKKKKGKLSKAEEIRKQKEMIEKEQRFKAHLDAEIKGVRDAAEEQVAQVKQACENSYIDVEKKIETVAYKERNRITQLSDEAVTHILSLEESKNTLSPSQWVDTVRSEVYAASSRLASALIISRNSLDSLLESAKGECKMAKKLGREQLESRIGEAMEQKPDIKQYEYEREVQRAAVLGRASVDSVISDTFAHEMQRRSRQQIDAHMSQLNDTIHETRTKMERVLENARQEADKMVLEVLQRSERSRESDLASTANKNMAETPSHKEVASTPTDKDISEVVEIFGNREMEGSAESVNNNKENEEGSAMSVEGKAAETEKAHIIEPEIRVEEVLPEETATEALAEPPVDITPSASPGEKEQRAEQILPAAEGEESTLRIHKEL